jgi:hypothetical protein
VNLSLLLLRKTSNQDFKNFGKRQWKEELKQKKIHAKNANNPKPEFEPLGKLIKK